MEVLESQNLLFLIVIHVTNILYNIYVYIYIYIYIYINYIHNCLCGSVAKASDTQTVGHGFEPRPEH